MLFFVLPNILHINFTTISDYASNKKREELYINMDIVESHQLKCAQYMY